MQIKKPHRIMLSKYVIEIIFIWKFVPQQIFCTKICCPNIRKFVINAKICYPLNFLCRKCCYPTNFLYKKFVIQHINKLRIQKFFIRLLFRKTFYPTNVSISNVIRQICYTNICYPTKVSMWNLLSNRFTIRTCIIQQIF